MYERSTNQATVNRYGYVCRYSIGYLPLGYHSNDVLLSDVSTTELDLYMYTYMYAYRGEELLYIDGVYVV